MSDPTGVDLRAIQYAGGTAIETIYRRLAKQIDAILMANLEWPNGRRKPPVLTESGRIRVLAACRALFDRAAPELTAIIQRAIAETQAMAERTEERAS